MYRYLILFIFITILRANNNEYDFKNVRLPKIPITIFGEKYLSGDIHNIRGYKATIFDPADIKAKWNVITEAEATIMIKDAQDAFIKLKINQDKNEFDHGIFPKSFLMGSFFMIGYASMAYLMVWEDTYKDYDDDYDLIWTNRSGYDRARKMWGIVGGLGSFWVPLVFFPNKQSSKYQQQYISNSFITTVTELDENHKKKEILFKHKSRGVIGKLSHQIEVSTLKNNLDKRFPKWTKINDLIKDYNKPFQYRDLEVSYYRESKKLYLQRGEFETTPQYNERMRIDKIKEQNLKANYDQNIALRQAEFDKEKLLVFRELEEMAKDIKFEKEYRFRISKYDADEQCYRFKIDGFPEKKITIPLSEAPSFKADIEHYKVKDIFKPTLDGRWEKLNNEVMLVDNRTDSNIAWDGAINTYTLSTTLYPPIINTSIKIDEPSKDGFLDSEEEVKVLIILENNGEGQAGHCQINLKQESGPQLFYEVSKTITSIPINDQNEVEFKIEVPENVKSGEASFVVNFLEVNGFEPPPLKFKVDVREQLKPILDIVDFGVLDQDGDGRVTKGETAEITARIQNRGRGKAKNVTIQVNTNPLKNIYLAPFSKPFFDIGDILSGEYEDISFTILTNNRVEEIVSVELVLKEKRPQFSIVKNIDLEIDKIQNELEPIVFKGIDNNWEIGDYDNLSIDIEQNIPKGKKTSSHALAIIFGIEKYKNVSDANFASRDANFIKEYFEKVLQVPSKNIYYRNNSDVSKAEFDKVFSSGGWLDKRLKKGKTDIYVYFSGHGAPDIKLNKAYLIPYDGDPNYASQTGYELDFLYSGLGKMDAKSTTVFIDACFSGVNRENEMILANARPVFIEINENYSIENLTVFTASGGKEISSSWPEKKHGLFSYYLMKGMRGDADKDNDSNITYGELGDYIKENVTLTAGMLDREQTPTLSTQNENNIFITY